MNLLKLINKINTEEDKIKLFNLLLTEKEIISLEERIKILQELNQGKTQRQIASELNCSVVTVTRGAKVYNKNQDFIKKILD